MILDILIAVIAHELAHVGIAFAHGLRVRAVRLSWSRLCVAIEAGPPIANLRIALAGPGINLLLALAAWFSSPAFAKINLALGILNMIPFRGSDGSRVWRECKAIYQYQLM